MPITEPDLTTAQNAWGIGLIAIAQTYEADGIDGARAVASRFLDETYGYNLGPVLFKPTMASGKQTFRPTKQGALSYFVGHDPQYPLDSGFGLKGWRDVQSETATSYIDNDIAMWMGQVTMTNKDGQVTKVDKSFGYKQGADDMLRIVLHHSSLPYQP
ncbi:MAG: phosphoribosyl-AMP cyclohydrolase [Acidimicrobiia bacterium]|nr:phosphoribosyl-AMP cyclohydrolase [Acidimicrobiia bacterium]MYC57417.1 phosphoribosyl-AMP cyclohydrolase [Acidimicrobiia bacterium]MYG94614.1 phosphoribosyl-AMP cyclohydrolase [Acidimicrobiia bacterium]MYI30255.1 phosphoribosyl-AMP cyclohydrolase [Acidimicrobiia bacterium]